MAERPPKILANDDTVMLPVVMVTSSIGQEKTKAVAVRSAASEPSRR